VQVYRLFSTEKIAWAVCYLLVMLVPSIFVVIQKTISKAEWKWSYLKYGCQPLNLVWFTFMDLFRSASSTHPKESIFQKVKLSFQIELNVLLRYLIKNY
jgi:hypothetical protein